MARDAVWTLLNGDSELQDLGGPGFMVLEQYSQDQPPEGAAFIMICWRHVDFDDDIQDNAGRHFDLYAHLPVKKSTRLGRIDNILDRCDAIFKSVNDSTDPAVGEDGWQLDQVVFEGRGLDFEDDDYETICKQASYMALACKVTA